MDTKIYEVKDDKKKNLCIDVLEDGNGGGGGGKCNAPSLYEIEVGEREKLLGNIDVKDASGGGKCVTADGGGGGKCATPMLYEIEVGEREKLLGNIDVKGATGGGKCITAGNGDGGGGGKCTNIYDYF